MNETRPVKHVSAGRTISAWCDACSTSALEVTGMYALGDSGPVLIGVMVECINCGQHRWECRYCSAVLPLSGSLAFAHIRDQHAV